MALPDFIVIGAGRSGTTSLHHCLRQHPAIYMCPHKSPNHFVSGETMPAREGPEVRAMARQWVRSRDAYERLFEGARAGQILGEVSPVYLQSTRAPAAIRDAVPDARLIAVLRDPVDRAYAHFVGRRRDGLEKRADFGEVVRQELAEGLPDDVAFGSYLGCGLYHRFLSGFYDRFPRERIRVFLFEDLCADLPGLMADIHRFLRVDDDFVPDTSRRYNQTGEIENPVARFLWTRTTSVRTFLRPYWPSFVRDNVQPLRAVNLVKPALDTGLRTMLADVFREDIRRLEALIDRDLSSWTAPPPAGRSGSAGDRRRRAD